MLPDKKFFQDYCRSNNIPWRERDILREYLQTQVLKVLSLSEYNNALSFLGGTSLRFIHNINRFSEDLDFDLIKKDGFDINGLSKEILRGLDLGGFSLDQKVKTTENIHIIYLKFKNVLQEFGFRVHKDEKFFIKFEIDFSPYKNIKTEARFVDNFNERFPILINTLPTLFAQKIIALKLRPYQKGRDFYDLVWFLAQKDIEPEYAILEEKNISVENKAELILELEKIISESNLEQAKRDVSPFLFYPDRADWILKLPEYIKNY